MASFGFQIPGQQKRHSSCFYPNKTMSCCVRRNLVLTLGGFILLCLLPGCMSTIKYGSPPLINHLETLKPGTSSKADVLMALGEPRGHGAARFTPDTALREIWYYEYTEFEEKRISLKFLLVFFDNQRYGGYLWFSSAGLLEGT